MTKKGFYIFYTSLYNFFFVDIINILKILKIIHFNTTKRSYKLYMYYILYYIIIYLIQVPFEPNLSPEYTYLTPINYLSTYLSSTLRNSRQV